MTDRHYSAIEMNGHPTLTEGRRVDFEVGIGTKGPQADSLRPA